MFRTTGFLFKKKVRIFVCNYLYYNIQKWVQSFCIQMFFFHLPLLLVLDFCSFSIIVAQINA